MYFLPGPEDCLGGGEEHLSGKSGRLGFGGEYLFSGRREQGWSPADSGSGRGPSKTLRQHTTLILPLNVKVSLNFSNNLLGEGNIRGEHFWQAGFIFAYEIIEIVLCNS